jgi:shikimate kinase
MLVFLFGFRATGKSTIAKELCEVLGYRLVELDKLIEQKSSQSISSLTNSGKDWFNFRLIETEVILDLCTNPIYNNLIISCGGGVAVNDVRKGFFRFIFQASKNLKSYLRELESKYSNHTFDTFGELQRKIIFANHSAVPILLTTPYQVLESRLTSMYQNEEKSIHRQSLSGSATETIKQKVQNDMQIYSIREPLYESLSEFVVSTQEPIDHCISRILEFISHKGLSKTPTIRLS